MRRAARRDANHATLREGLRVRGYWVRDTGDLGNGWPDLAVRDPRSGVVKFLEIKDPAKPPSARKLTPAEEEVRDLLGDLYVVVETLQDALDAMTC